MESPVIEVNEVTKHYWNMEEEVRALSPISFSIQSSEFVSLVGPSGCGKSTILSLVAGLLPPTSGEVTLFGKKVTYPSPRVGYMLQRDCLLDWRTVKDNINLGLELSGTLNHQTESHARHLLNELGLGHTLHQYPAQLSGGMRQRVALVRTLALQPDILLLDEPFSALDIQNKLHLEDLLVQALKGRGMTTLLVTHDLEEALALSTRILVLTGSPGRLKRTVEIPPAIRSLDPLPTRDHPDFRPLFHDLWKELEKS
ncbi:ABC transporter ATP-binding protein [Desmospora profundinema]|uniref:NitT/TauT family transport system ATP-binding protein n=1 Tax=Desmospora profundinema TaxID=1571184 RepID=A0ABU1IQM6_9BACL|nr:ABC transporter ATP-binding protein [Desmospora profundinema]MDR6226449.1 NitT/TauT family transport system ATP-binding protein [Desmospora profundinema]